MRLATIALCALLCAGPAYADSDRPINFLLEQQAPTKEAGKNRRASRNHVTRANVPPFIRGRLVCARNVNAALAQRGIQGTGSALAFSFLRWGRPSGPQPGAVRVSARRGGGHVMIVSHQEDGKWLCLNPSTRRQQWQVVPCNSGSRAISYRIA